MGIRGLTSFINGNSTIYYENHQLKDTLIIIDGPALTHFLYSHGHHTNVFLGNYDVIAKTYIDFINLLLRCNVTPIFVFDGALEQRKVETFVKRVSEDIQSYGRRTRPIFFGNILYNILNYMDIPLVKCDFEADSEIVALAKLFNCPIVSQDSDFYVNTVPYIPLDMIILDFKSTENVINCRIYKFQKLLNTFGGLKDDLLPLVSVLLGNDYIATDTFSMLLRISPRTFDCELKLKRILEWLRNQKNIDSAIDNMTNSLFQNKNYIKNQIKTIVREYSSLNIKYLPFIFQYKIMTKYQDGLKNCMELNEKSILPHWLEHNYRRGIVSGDVMTILTLKKIFFKIQPEDFKLPSYYEVSLKIIETILGLLFEEKVSIIGMGRKKGFNIERFNIKPYRNNRYVPLADLNKTDLRFRKNIILNLIGVKKFIGVPKEWELFILVVIYWAIHTNNRKTSHMHALIVSAMTFNIIKKIETDSENKTFEESTNKTNNTIEQNIINVKREDCIKAKSVLSKYFHVHQYKDMNMYCKIIHPLSQFQSCVHYFMILNSLLDFPYDLCRIEHFFNGPFLYNLCVKMENCNPEVFVSQLFDSNLDSLNKIYKSIISYMDMLLSISKIVVDN